tara:strand:+ start:1546 stop:1662 length:117 start_codon:yes stop_codon:yes gene_type:complete
LLRWGRYRSNFGQVLGVLRGQKVVDGTLSEKEKAAPAP